MSYATIGISAQPPVSRREIPVLTLRPEQVIGLPDRLRAFWRRFAALFQADMITEATSGFEPLIGVLQTPAFL